MHFNPRHLIDAKLAVAVEVRLHHAAVFKIDGSEKSGRKAKANAAFHLRFDNLRIYGLAAIDRRDDALHLRKSVSPGGYLNGMGDETAE